jgi:hypothetical protein
LYRWRLGNRLKPGRELFIKMQELGATMHPLTGIDLAGYDLPELTLGNVGGSLVMLNTTVKGPVYQEGATFKTQERS